MCDRLKVLFLSLIIILITFETSLFILSSFYNSTNCGPDKEDVPLICCFGDSFVYGLGVDEGKDYPGLLEDMITGYKVINFGIPGENSSQMLNRIRKVLEEREAKIVTVQVGINNFWNVSEKRVHDQIEEHTLKRKIFSVLFKSKTFRFFYIVFNKINKVLIPDDNIEVIYPDSSILEKEKHSNIIKKYDLNRIDENQSFTDWIKSIADSEKLSIEEKNIFKTWEKSLENKDYIISEDQHKKSILFSLMLIENRIHLQKYTEALRFALEAEDDICVFLYRSYLYYLLGIEKAGKAWLEVAIKIEDSPLTNFFKKMSDIFFKKSKDIDNIDLIDKINLYQDDFKQEYTEFYKLNDLILFFKSAEKIEGAFLKDYLFELFLETHINKLYKVNTLVNPFFYNPKYQEILNDINFKLIEGMERYIDIFPDLRGYLYLFSLKMLDRIEQKQYSKKIHLLNVLRRKFPDKKYLYESIIAEYFRLSTEQEYQKKRLYDLMYYPDKDNNRNNLYYFVNCSRLFIDIIDNRPSSSYRLRKLSEQAIELFDEKIFYIYKSFALKTLFQLRELPDIEETISFHQSAIDRFKEFDLYHNLGEIYRLLYMKKAKKEYLIRSTYFLRKAFEMRKDDGILNLIILNLGILGDKKSIVEIFEQNPTIKNIYDIETIIRLSRDNKMDINIFEPNSELKESSNELDIGLLNDLKEVMRICKRKGTKLIFINYLQSEIPEMKSLNNDDVYFLDIYKRFGKDVIKYNLNKYDYFLGDGHLTSLGNRYVAERLVEFMKENELLSAADEIEDF